MTGQMDRHAAREFAEENLGQLAADVLVWRKKAALPAGSKMHELASLCCAYTSEGDEYQEAERLTVHCALENTADSGQQSGAEHAAEALGATSTASMDEAAYKRLLPKLLVLSETIDDMSDDQYGEWIDALPKDEFFEFIGVSHNKESFLAAVDAARQQVVKSCPDVSAAS